MPDVFEEEFRKIDLAGTVDVICFAVDKIYDTINKYFHSTQQHQEKDLKPKERNENNLDYNTEKAIKQENEISNMLDLVKDNFKTTKQPSPSQSNNENAKAQTKERENLQSEKVKDKIKHLSIEFIFPYKVYEYFNAPNVQIIQEIETNFKSSLKLNKPSTDLRSLILTGTPQQNASSILFIQSFILNYEQ